MPAGIAVAELRSSRGSAWSCAMAVSRSGRARQDHVAVAAEVHAHDVGVAVGQHGALVDRALVGDLAAVDRRRLGQHERARHARRAAGAGRRAASRPGAGRTRAPRGVAEHLRRAARRPAGRRSARQASSAREDQQADLVAVDAGDRRRPARSGSPAAMICARSGPTETKVPVASLKSSAMRPSNTKPSSGRAGSIGLSGVAAAVEAFVVEALGRLLGRAPVAGRDVRAAVAHLELVADRHELQLDARRRQADVARLAPRARWRRSRTARSRSCRGR